MKKGDLSSLRDENPKRLVSAVRLAWEDIKAALDRGHSIKVIHERFCKTRVEISYRLFTMYVGQLKREGSNPEPAIDLEYSTALNHRVGFIGPQHGEESIALVRVPKRRLFSAKAAAQYLGIHDQTLKRLTSRREVLARRLGSRWVYRLEDLDHYIESLPRSA